MYSILLLLLSPFRWLLLNLIQYYLLYLFTILVYRSYKLLWCARNLLTVSPNEAVFITGATSGIGLQLAKHLYKLGYSVLIGYFDDKEVGFGQLKTLAQNTKTSRQNKIIFVPINVRDLNNIEQAYKLLEEVLSQNKLRLYALINNAGLGNFTPFKMSDKREIGSILETNIYGTMMTTRVLLPLLLEKPGSRLINVASGLGIFPGPSYVTYGVTKAAQIYFTRALNTELNKSYSEQELKCVTVLPHNFIKHTNIGSNLYEKHQAIWNEQQLSAKEQNLYKLDHERHRKRLERFCKISREFNKRKLQGLNVNNNESFSDKLKEFVEVLRGKNCTKGLDDPEFLRSFELALRLPNPPEEIFAGDRLFNLITGPIILTLPTCCLSWFGLAVNDSLYK